MNQKDLQSTQAELIETHPKHLICSSRYLIHTHSFIRPILKPSNDLDRPIPSLRILLRPDRRIQLQSLLRLYPFRHRDWLVESWLDACFLKDGRVVDRMKHSVAVRACKVQEACAVVGPLVAGWRNLESLSMLSRRFGRDDELTTRWMDDFKKPPVKWLIVSARFTVIVPGCADTYVHMPSSPRIYNEVSIDKLLLTTGLCCLGIIIASLT